jgi:hypothetical protein
MSKSIAWTGRGCQSSEAAQICIEYVYLRINLYISGRY